MKITEIINEIDRRGVLKAIGSAVASSAFTPTDANAKDTKQQTSQKPQQLTLEEKLKDFLIKQATKLGIKGAELAQLISQVEHETGNFVHMVELGDRTHFKKYEISHNPKKAQSLGNIHPGDGERFKGRGFLQITGRANYEDATEFLKSKGINVDLTRTPDVLATNPQVNALASLHYWQTRVKPNVKNFNDVKQVTKQINPGMKGLAKRIKNFANNKASKLFSKS